MSDTHHPTPEHRRLAEDAARHVHWKRWGPYLAERQWGTVREDYSDVGSVWDYLPHDHSRSRAYRWGEDGLLGFCDSQARLCFSLALWNGADGILKERLFGLTNHEGNHGEDVKEEYFYLRSTPTHSYSKALYKYPQAEYPYDELIKENAKRGEADREHELAGTGLWDEEDGFYYDQIKQGDKVTPLKVRSLVGLIPLAGVEIVREVNLEKLPGFAKRFRWFLENQPELAQHIVREEAEPARYLISAVPPERLTRILAHLLDEDEFLSPYGIRSMSRHHDENPFTLRAEGKNHTAHYTPGESKTVMFGGNSNWRGPVWFPLNHLLVETLDFYEHLFGDVLRFRYPARKEGERIGLHQIANKLRARLGSIFQRDPASGRRPFADDNPLWDAPENRDLILFHEYFHAETGRGLGASHQTGWTALAAMHLENLADGRN